MFWYFGAGGVLCLVFSVWCLVPGVSSVWYLVFGAWYLVFGAWYLVVWCLLYGVWCLVPGVSGVFMPPGSAERAARQGGSPLAARPASLFAPEAQGFTARESNSFQERQGAEDRVKSKMNHARNRDKTRRIDANAQ